MFQLWSSGFCSVWRGPTGVSPAGANGPPYLIKVFNGFIAQGFRPFLHFSPLPMDFSCFMSTIKLLSEQNLFFFSSLPFLKTVCEKKETHTVLPPVIFLVIRNTIIDLHHTGLSLHSCAPLFCTCPLFNKLEVNKGVLKPVTKPAVTWADSISRESLLDSGWGLGGGLYGLRMVKLIVSVYNQIKMKGKTILDLSWNPFIPSTP